MFVPLLSGTQGNGHAASNPRTNCTAKHGTCILTDSSKVPATSRDLFGRPLSVGGHGRKSATAALLELCEERVRSEVSPSALSTSWCRGALRRPVSSRTLWSPHHHVHPWHPHTHTHTHTHTHRRRPAPAHPHRRRPARPTPAHTRRRHHPRHWPWAALPMELREELAGVELTPLHAGHFPSTRRRGHGLTASAPTSHHLALNVGRRGR
jgi:hypothetical protein